MMPLDVIAPPEPDSDHRHVTLAVESGIADRVHLLGKGEISAVNAAIAAGRPLLVRGEPGIGKSQLARAAAKELGRAFVKHVIDSHTESRDLMWNFDAVRRLAEAQLAGALHEPPDEVRRNLAVERYLTPGPLWWAFDWADAACQCEIAQGTPPTQPDGGDWRKGCVMLLDEIDKAEAEVPNGLLEALGMREFTPMGRSAPVCAAGRPPLVVITTNEERMLPDAFMRRCLVLRLALPRDENGIRNFLVTRGRAHFPTADDTVLWQAAAMLAEDRQHAIHQQIRPWPGQAEYLDLLRAVLGLAPQPREQMAMLEEVRTYTLRKQAGAEPD